MLLKEAKISLRKQLLCQESSATKYFGSPATLHVSRHLNDPTAILCLLCQRLLLKVKKLEEDMNSTIAQIDLKLNLHCGIIFAVQ